MTVRASASPLTRIENAFRGIGSNANCSDLAPKDIKLVRREIQEIREALEAFRAAVEAGEAMGFKPGGMSAHSG